MRHEKLKIISTEARACLLNEGDTCIEVQKDAVLVTDKLLDKPLISIRFNDGKMIYLFLSDREAVDLIEQLTRLISHDGVLQ